MRFQCIVLIALAFFYVGIDTADALIRAEQAVPSKTTGHNCLSSSTNTGRLLRAEIGDDGGEERLPNSEWVSRLAQADRKVPKLRKLDMKLSQWLWIRDGKTPEELFYTFSNLYNTWAKIESNKKTVQWFRFVEAYRAKWGTGRFVDQDIYRLLSTKVREDKLAIVFETDANPGRENSGRDDAELPV
uniref:Avh334 n=1 Tax=Phytophthora sojae TaxID=67593 RepID=G1FSV3_PHYSO|nr:Avh334 [Phytophthora sojae]